MPWTARRGWRAWNGGRPRPAAGRRLSEVVPGILTGDPTMRRISRRCERLVGHPTRMLLQGESGTGRKTLARMLCAVATQRRGTIARRARRRPAQHRQRPDATDPAVQSRRPRISDIDDLFDRVPDPGADDEPARRARSGRDPRVHRTRDCSPEDPAALLRRLVEAEAVWRERATLPRTISVATADLGMRIAEDSAGSLRPDRRGAPLFLPALRNRGDGSVELADWFLQRFQQSLGRHRLRLSDEAIDAIGIMPGRATSPNSAMRSSRPSSRPKGPACGRRIWDSIPDADAAGQPAGGPARGGATRRRPAAVERVNGNIARASEMLGIDHATLYDLLNKLGMR